MITLIISILLSALIIEFFFFLENKKVEKELSDVKINNNKLEILKELSYLLLAKNTSFKEVLDKLSLSFFKQENYISFSLILPTGDFRYPISSVDTQQNTLEQFLISRYKQKISGNPEKEILLEKNAVLIPIFYKNFRLGCAIFFKKNNTNSTEIDINFLRSIVDIVSLIITNFNLEALVSKEERVRASNTEW